MNMTEKNITRREALKAILAVAGGVGASAFIPPKWLKPVVQSGMMPAHAVVSGIITVPQEGGITAHVYQHDGVTSISGANVTATQTVGGITIRTKTTGPDGEGVAIFSGLPYGRYAFTCNYTLLHFSSSESLHSNEQINKFSYNTPMLFIADSE